MLVYVVYVMLIVFGYSAIRNTLAYRFLIKTINGIHTNYCEHSDKIKARILKLKANPPTSIPEAYRELDKIEEIQRTVEANADAAWEAYEKVTYDSALFSLKRFKNLYSEEDKAKMNWKLEI